MHLTDANGVDKIMKTNNRQCRRIEPAIHGKSQNGAVLLISLILLLVMTLIGVTNMSSSSLQFKMASNNQQRARAFNAAEFVLNSVEREMQSDALIHDPEHHVKRCDDGGPCYSSDCENGYCFEGTYATAETPPECALTADEDTSVGLWARDAGEIWNTAGKYQEMEILDTDITPKYIVEFLCFVDKDPETAVCALATTTNCVPQFRITVLAEGTRTNAKVMLQSTTKVGD